MITPQLFKNLYNLERQMPKSYNFDLSNFKAFLKQYNNPQNSIGKIIHIAGTNGKGSVAMILSNILTESGYKVGLYTSPHLYEINERIKLNNKSISNYMFKKFEKEIYYKIKKRNKNYRTFFEAMTLLAFLYFKKMRTDYAIIEVGLGGRLDSTNIVNPYISIITAIDFDHTKFLGNTIEKITREKCGIIKNNAPVFTFKQNNKIMKIIKENTIKKDAKLYITDIKKVNIINKSCFEYKEKFYKIYQLGDYQKYNSALAIDIASYMGIRKKYIKKGIENFYIKGRLEIYKKNPIIIIDSSHNAHAVKNTLNEINKLFSKKELYIIAAFMQDKDYKKIINIMKKYSKNIILTTIPFFRAATKTHYENIEGITFENNLKIAYSSYLNKKKKNSLLLIIGSFYIMPFVKKYII